jgi:hypothetical protein
VVKKKNVNFERVHAAVEELFWNKAAQSDPTLRFWSVVQVPLLERCDRFRAVLRDWLDGLSPVIRTTVVEYARLAAKHSVDSGPVQWAAGTVRSLLQKRFGNPSWPKTPSIERTQDLWTWLAGDSTPYPPLVADVAYLTCGESLTIMRVSSENPEVSIDINEDAVGLWRAPRWLDFHLLPGEHALHISPTERWDQENTRVQLLTVQRWIWHRLDAILETSVLEAQVAVADMPEQRGKTGRRKRRTSPRYQLIRKAIRAKKTRIAYCVELDHLGLKTPDSWQSHGCPEKYREAYKDTKWRQMICNERYNAKRDMPPT